MSPGWAILTTRYGEDVRQPSAGDLARAADELHTEAIEGMTEADYAEHPNAWLRYGLDEGPMYVIDAYRDGRVLLSKYGDQDYAGPVTKHTLTGASRQTLLSLWERLGRGEVEQLRAEHPGLGW